MKLYENEKKTMNYLDKNKIPIILSENVLFSDIFWGGLGGTTQDKYKYCVFASEEK